MKRLLMICVVVISLCAPAVLIAASCDSETGYFIVFTFEGETHRVSLGFTDVDEGDAFASALSEDETTMLIMFGTDEDVDSTTWDLSTTANWALLAVEGVSTGEYLYSGEEMQAYIAVNGEMYRADSGSIVITSSGTVGEVIEGTFSIDTTPFSEPNSIESGKYHTLAGNPATGTFRVLRAANDLELPF